MTQEKSEIKSLTGLRGFAALWVAVLHTCFGEGNEFGYLPAFDHKINWGFFTDFVLQGYLAVDIFFVLSGFVMAYVYGDIFHARIRLKEVLHFYIKRLARIYPVHIVITLILAIVFFLGWWNPFQDFTAWHVALSAVLMNMWVHPSPNMPAWSVSAEWMAYLACPAILWAGARLQKIYLCLAGVIILTLLYPFLYQHYLDWNWLYGWTALVRVFTGFIIGSILFQIYSDEKAGRFLAKWSDRAFVILFGALFLLCLISSKPSVSTIYPFAPLFVLFLAGSRTFVARLFSSTVFRYLGAISYCIYMVHYPVLEFINQNFSDVLYALPPDFSRIKMWGIFSLILAAIIAVAAVAYHLIERPCRRWIVKKWGN